MNTDGYHVALETRKAKKLIRAVATELFGDVGCYDTGCVFGFPGGMSTNGGCGCMKTTDPTELRWLVNKLHRLNIALARRITD